MMETRSRVHPRKWVLSLVLVLGIAIGFFARPPSATTQARFDDSALIERIRESVVNVSSSTVIRRPFGWDPFLDFYGIPRERKHSSLGSGFILNDEGFILTNFHNVENADEVVVTLLDKRSFAARIVGRDPRLDVALLQIRDKEGRIPRKLVPVRVGKSKETRVAESVFAIGNPFGLSHSVTKGIISAVNRTIGVGPFDNFLQTDASINPGNSGGPLFNQKGEVIGINTLIYSKTGQSGGLGFAIPIHLALSVLEDLKRYGRVPRPWLGFLAERMTPQLQRYFKLARPDGVLVFKLVAGGPALRAGLKRGDIIYSIAGKPIAEPHEIERTLARFRPNQTVEILIQRARKKLKLKMKLQELPSELKELPAGVL